MRALLLRASHSRVTLSRLKNNNLDTPSATLWLLDGRHVPEEDVAFFVQQLGASEARRYGRFRRRERRRQFLLGRMLLRLAVSRLMSLPPDVLAVIERTGSAPELVLPGSRSLGGYFSLSHSRNWVACVVGSNVTLGVDIEVNDPSRDVLGISQLGFHPNEHRWLLSQVDSARLSAFYHLWCTREALYKLTSSLGRQVALSPLVKADGVFALEGPDWHRYTLPHSFLMVAVCSDRPLSTLHKVELPRLTRADWSAAERVRPTSATSPQEASRRAINSAVMCFRT
jgi:4'-phosphopantetheinyl transferase